MIIEWIAGVTLLTAAGLLYRKKPSTSGEYERFSVVCSVLPAPQFEQLISGAEAVAESLARSARNSRVAENRVELALAEFLAPLVGVAPRKIPNPRQMFQEFAATQPDRVVTALRQQLTLWTRLSGDKMAAIVLMSLPPELSAQIFKVLQPDEVPPITLAISKLPQMPPGLNSVLIGQFLNLEDGHPNPEAQLAALAARDPDLLARMLRSL